MTEQRRRHYIRVIEQLQQPDQSQTGMNLMLCAMAKQWRNLPDDVLRELAQMNRQWAAENSRNAAALNALRQPDAESGTNGEWFVVIPSARRYHDSMPAAEIPYLRSERGYYFPAAATSQAHLVALACAGTPPYDKPSLVAAFESDPGLLLHALGTIAPASSLISHWHHEASAAMLRTLALARGLVTSGVDQQLVDHKPLRRSLIAQALAEECGANANECRVLALLGDIGLWLQPGVAIAASDHYQRAAEYLADLGFAGVTCDAIRYQSEPITALPGAAAEVRVVAAARILQQDSLHDATRMTRIAALLGVSSHQISAALESAANAFHQRTGELGSRQSTTARHDPVIDAIIADLIKSGADDLSSDTLASHLIGFVYGPLPCYLFVVSDQQLSCNTGGLTLPLNTSGSALVAGIKNQPTCHSIAELDLVAERSLLEKTSSSHLLTLPLPEQQGVLAIALPANGAVMIRNDGQLLNNIAIAVGHALHTTTGAAPDAPDHIALDLVKQQAREITHEVNNPLAIMQNYLRTLSMKLRQAPEVEEEIRALSRELSRIRTIIDKYQEIGQPPSLLYANTDLNNLVAEQLALIQAAAPTIQFTFDADQSIPVLELAGDALKQVIVNILKNAVEAVEDVADPVVKIRTTAAVNIDGKAFLELEITDNGVGMSHAQRLALFSGTQSTKGPGRGVGLNIVHQLMQDIGGGISCRNNPPRGSSFMVRIPVGSRPQGAT